METRTWLFVALLAAACVPLILAEEGTVAATNAAVPNAGTGDPSGKDGEGVAVRSDGNPDDKTNSGDGGQNGSDEKKDDQGTPEGQNGADEKKDDQGTPEGQNGADQKKDDQGTPEGQNRVKEDNQNNPEEPGEARGDNKSSTTTTSSIVSNSTTTSDERAGTTTEAIETVTKKEFDIIGVRMKSYLGRNFNAFCGIPYADATKERRFKQPTTRQYSGTIDATECEKTPVCMQIRWHKGEQEVIGVEDCLFLNVYEPEVTSVNMPVIVYFHGGGFFSGSGTFNDVGPHYFMDHDVVLVTINYRLGPLGFFGLNDHNAPGNLGLYDQYLALRWVQKYIRHFHGDKFRVTIMGEGAGGASVHLHLYSKMSEGLFSRAISQSGVAFNSWALMNDIINISLTHAGILGCKKNSHPATLKCMRNLDAAQIVNSTGGLRLWLSEPLMIYRPTVQKDRYGNDIFLPRDPMEILMEHEFHNVPWLVGTVNMPGFFHIQRYLKDEKLRSALLGKFSEFASEMLDLETSIPDPSKRETALKIIQDAYANLNGGLNRDALVQIFNDREGNLGQMLAVAYHTLLHHDKVYQYRFEYRGKHSMAENITGVKEDEVANEDDLIYLLRRPNLFPDFDRTTEEGKRDFQMMRKLTGIWAEFAATGEVKALHRNKRETATLAQVPTDTDGAGLLAELFQRRARRQDAVMDNSNINTSSINELIELMQVDKGGENASEVAVKVSQQWKDFVDLEWQNKSSCWDNYASIVWPPVKRFTTTAGNVPVLPYLSFRKGGNDTPVAYCLHYLMEFDRLNHWLQLPLLEVRSPEEFMLLEPTRTIVPETPTVRITTDHQCPVFTTPPFLGEATSEGWQPWWPQEPQEPHATSEGWQPWWPQEPQEPQEPQASSEPWQPWEPQEPQWPQEATTWPTYWPFDDQHPNNFPVAPPPMPPPPLEQPLPPTEKPVVLEEPEEPPEMDEEPEEEVGPEIVPPEPPKYSWPKYPKPPAPAPPPYPHVDLSLPPLTVQLPADARPFPLKPTPPSRPTTGRQFFTWEILTEKEEVVTEMPQKPQMPQMPQRPQRPKPHRPRPPKKPKSSAPPRSCEVWSYTSLLLLLLLVVQF